MQRLVYAARLLVLFAGHQTDDLPHGAEARAEDIDFVARLDDLLVVERFELGDSVFHVQADDFTVSAGADGVTVVAAGAEILLFGPGETDARGRPR